MSEVEARVEAEILAFMREELAAKGEEGSGLERWYRKNYVDQNRGYSPYSGVISDFLASRRGRFRRVTEVGAGIGQVCLHLAARGWDTIAIESWGVRFDMMKRLVERVAAIDAEVAGRVRPLIVTYPDDAPSYMDAETVVLFASLACSASVATEDRVISHLPLAGGVILDLRVFFRERQRGAEQDALIAQIESLGFRSPETVWDWPGEAGSFMPHRFIFFERKR